MKKAILNLGNSLNKKYIFKGKGVGAAGVYEGELVFTTNNSGYFKSATDPSFANQILVFNYPLIGNYGASDSWRESKKKGALAIVASEISDDYYHREAQSNFETWLTENGIGAITDVDTRQIVKIIRDNGTINARVTVYEEHQESLMLSNSTGLDIQVDMKNVIAENTNSQIEIHNANGNTIIGILDCGMKLNILNELLKRGVKVVVFPAKTSPEKILEYDLDGLLVSNGPGNPEDAEYVSKTINSLIKNALPIFGICLGNQLLSLASGAKTKKMKFGNRGSNQPVQDIINNRSFMTSQNHGYEIDEKTLGKEWKVWMRNLNDNSVEGVIHESLPFRSVQFHPEASPGPHDTSFLFDEFIDSLDTR